MELITESDKAVLAVHSCQCWFLNYNFAICFTSIGRASTLENKNILTEILTKTSFYDITTSG